MGYILSVDGGGSKTLYCLYEIENDYKEYIRGDSTNYKNIGIDVVKSNLEKNINEIMNKKNISFQDIKYFVFGFSSCDTAEDYKLFKKILEDIGVKENFVIMNDAELALTQAKLNLNQSIYNYMVAKSDMEKVLGQETY